MLFDEPAIDAYKCRKCYICAKNGFILGPSCTFQYIILSLQWDKEITDVYANYKSSLQVKMKQSLCE